MRKIVQQGLEIDGPDQYFPEFVPQQGLVANLNVIDNSSGLMALDVEVIPTITGGYDVLLASGERFNRRPNQGYRLKPVNTFRKLPHT